MCEYVQVPCVHSGCGELVTRSNLVEHLERSCQFRMEKCEYCQTLVEFAFLEVRITLLKSVVCRHLEQDPEVIYIKRTFTSSFTTINF